MDSCPIRGTCMLMCPERETEMREKEGLIHILESRQTTSGRTCSLQADRHKMVKMFSRSAAGRDLLQSEDLRPFPILKRTINYLLSVVVYDAKVPWCSVCSFITDRLRAIRQDMVVQQLPEDTSCSLLEPIVRFHAYAAYSLCEEPIDVFDPVLNKTHLNDTLKQLLVCYDKAEQHREKMSPSRDQMEALYGLLHLGKEDAIYRMLSLYPPKGSLLDAALQISLNDFRGNYLAVCCLLNRLPTLLACVAALHLPRIRRQALLVMNCAYSSKALVFPLSILTSWLMYESVVEAAEECRHYGLRVTPDQSVQFVKGTFQSGGKDRTPKRLKFIDETLGNLSLSELLLTVGHSEE